MFYVPFVQPRNKVQDELRSLAPVVSQEHSSPGPRPEHCSNRRAGRRANATSLAERQTSPEQPAGGSFLEDQHASRAKKCLEGAKEGRAGQLSQQEQSVGLSRPV